MPLPPGVPFLRQSYLEGPTAFGVLERYLRHSMASPSSEGTLPVVAGAMVQCFFYGLYTALFFSTATFTLSSERPRRWTLLHLNTTIYLLSTATLYYDLVMACVSVETQNAVRLYRLAQGGDPKFLRTRISLFIVISTITGFLVIWRLSRLWSRAMYLAAFASFLNVLVGGSGLVLIHLRAGGPELNFRYDLYRRMAFSLYTCLMVLNLCRSYWLSRRLRKFYELPTFACSFTRACIDSGVVFVLCYSVNLGLTFSDIFILRPVLPQFAGIAGALILFQESMKKSAQDPCHAVCANQGARNGRSTPILDTLFSTPGGSIQYTIGGGGRQNVRRRSQVDESPLGSPSGLSVQSCNQQAVGDDGLGARKSKSSVHQATEEVRPPEKAHGVNEA